MAQCNGSGFDPHSKQWLLTNCFQLSSLVGYCAALSSAIQPTWSRKLCERVELSVILLASLYVTICMIQRQVEKKKVKHFLHF